MVVGHGGLVASMTFTVYSLKVMVGVLLLKQTERERR